MESQSTKARRKRIYLVNRDFQFRYTGAAVLVGLTSTALTIFIILYPLYQFEILRIPKFLPLPILGTMFAAALINIILVGLMGVIITHKIAGPMYSMVRQFRRVENGQWYGRMGLRPDDEMKYLVRNFNEMLHGIQRQSQGDLEILDQMIGDLDKSGVRDGSSLHVKLLEVQARLKERLVEPTEVK